LPKVLLLAPILAIVSVGPGLLVTRHLRWGPTERLCGAVGASLLLLYLAGFGLYALDAPSSSAWWLTGLCAVALLAAAPQLRRLARNRGVREVVVGYAALVAWTLVLVATVRVFCGGGWVGDWLEHYERALFFVDRLDPGTRILKYPLTARPPLANVVVAHFLAQTGRSFAAYQVVTAFLSVLVFLPSVLLVRTLGGRRSAVAILAGLLALNPFFVQNATYPWTKLLSAFFVLLGIGFYLRGWSKNDPGRMLACAVALAAGVLAHYSATPFVVAVALHYGVRLAWTTGRRVRVELPAMAVGGAAVLATWFGWSLAALGARSTFASNTSVRDSSSRTFVENALKIAGNIVDTFVPHPLRNALESSATAAHGGLGYVHDYFFLIYQPNVLAAIGMVGGIAAAFVFWRNGQELGTLGRAGATTRPRLAEQRVFWWFVVGVGLVLGIGSVGSRDPFGAAHVTLQPLVLLGVVAIAAGWPTLSRRWREAVLWGAVVDFSLGILLHFVAQSANPALRAVADLPRRYWRPLLNLFVSASAQRNAALKLERDITFLGDQSAPVLGFLFLAIAGAAAWVAVVLARHVHDAEARTARPA
jgi:hypothetical protein